MASFEVTTEVCRFTSQAKPQGRDQLWKRFALANDELSKLIDKKYVKGHIDQALQRAISQAIGELVSRRLVLVELVPEAPRWALYTHHSQAGLTPI